LSLLDPAQPDRSAWRPEYMTLAMWFAWLLRDDMRRGAAPDDSQAQYNIVPWWLIVGRKEYPAVWWYGPKQMQVAMSPAHEAGGVWLPLLLLYARRTRSDLQRAFDLETKAGIVRLLCWYRLHGPREFDAAPALPPDLVAVTEAGVADPPIAIALREAGLTRLPPPTPLPNWLEPLPIQRTAQVGGIELIGTPRAPTGIGEDVRSTSLALSRAAIQHQIIDVESPPAPISSAAVSIFCSTAFDTARLYLEAGPGIFSAPHRIGSWAWELPRFPAIWAEVFGLVEEVWGHSRFSAQSLRSISPVPVNLALSCVSVSGNTAQNTGPYDDAPFVFYYAFDPRSYMARKNPLALLQAFQTAFPVGDRLVALRLHTNGAVSENGMLQAFMALALQDDRVRWSSKTLPRADSLALLASVDCFVSPHRAEGFGRNIGEAILLGVPVLATGFSGPADYLIQEEQIRWSFRALSADDYPFGDGQVWAEPDVMHLAERMREVRLRRARRTTAGQKALAARATLFDGVFGPNAASGRYARLLARQSGQRSAAVSFAAADTE
jgi:glycosyltransferase involved in cell wall biosynthesis